MEKVYRIGQLSMSAKAYEKFVSLTKEKQVEALLKTMSPKNEELANELLTRVPNGDNIGKGNAKQAEQDNSTDGKGSGSGTSDARPKADTGKGK